MVLNDFAYDPIIRNGVKFVKVVNIHDMSRQSLFTFNDLQLQSTNMTDEEIFAFYSRLVKNKELIGRGFRKCRNTQRTG
jgi:hypothetical protein